MTLTLINSLQQRIDFVTLLKIFWLTKIIILPLGLRQMYTNPFVVNTTINMDTLDNNVTLDYNETFSKTIYFTLLYYGTETSFT